MRNNFIQIWYHFTFSQQEALLVLLYDDDARYVMNDYFKRMQDKQRDDMMHYYHYKKMQDEKRKDEEARKNGTIPARSDSLGRKLAKGLGVIIALGAILIILRALFNMM